MFIRIVQGTAAIDLRLFANELL